MLIPRLAILWLAVFPILLFVNAELLGIYLMITVYLVMILFGWSIAAATLGGFVPAIIFTAIIAGVVIFYSRAVERKYREQTRGVTAGSQGRAAMLESVPTYCAQWTNLSAGAIAGGLIGLFPALFVIVHRMTADVGTTLNKGAAVMLLLGTDRTASITLVVYLALVGLMAAWLRRHRGFAKQMVWPVKHSYSRRRPDSTFYSKFLMYWWPVLTFFVVASVSKPAMGTLMTYIFLWAFSGVLFKTIWSNLHLGILACMGAHSGRRLDYELLLRVKLENEPDLHACRYDDIVVENNGNVRISGEFKGDDVIPTARKFIESLIPGSAGRVTLLDS